MMNDPVMHRTGGQWGGAIRPRRVGTTHGVRTWRRRGPARGRDRRDDEEPHDHVPAAHHTDILTMVEVEVEGEVVDRDPGV